MATVISTACRTEDALTQITRLKHLDSLLAVCIRDVMTDLFGKHARDAIFDYLERTHGIGRDELPSHLETMMNLFERIFGKSHRVIERSIVKRMTSKLKWEFEDSAELDFLGHIAVIRDRFAMSSRNNRKCASCSFSEILQSAHAQ